MGLQRSWNGRRVQNLLAGRAGRMATIEVADADAEAVSGGTETVLLVEDEDALRQASAEFLSLRGYTVLQAKDGQDALSIAKNHANAIDLAVTDVGMPRVSEGQLTKELAEVRPETRVLFVSGYAGQNCYRSQSNRCREQLLAEALHAETTGGESTGGLRSQQECHSGIATESIRKRHSARTRFE